MAQFHNVLRRQCSFLPPAGSGRFLGDSSTSRWTECFRPCVPAEFRPLLSTHGLAFHLSAIVCLLNKNVKDQKMSAREKAIRAYIKQQDDALTQRLTDRKPVDGDMMLLIAQNNLIILLLDEMRGRK